MIVAPEKSSGVFTVKFISFQNRRMQQRKSLCMLNRNIPVNTVILFKINPKLQNCHRFALIDKVRSRAGNPKINLNAQKFRKKAQRTAFRFMPAAFSIIKP